MKMSILNVFIFMVFAMNEYTKYKEKWRPQYHFSPPRHWMNDPNGLSYFNNYYHMFFQYNADGIVIGNQSWGHAVSVDLVFWKYVDIAIPRQGKNFMFSGCGVVFNETLNAIYTVYHLHENGSVVEDEYLSYSSDGFHFKSYIDNPILTHHTNQLQDPKVMKYVNEESDEEYFVMAVSIPDKRVIQFYKSSNLLHWEYLSEFGNKGSVEYHWEMPVLSKIRNDVYILIVNVGYYAQYFLGNFDGSKFSSFEEIPQFRKVDYGPDFFETQNFYQSGMIGTDVIVIANVVNYHYALNLPTTVWRNTQSLPRKLSVEKITSTEEDSISYKLIQQPIPQLKNLRTGKSKNLKNLTVIQGDSLFVDIPFSKTVEIEVMGIMCSEECDFELHVLTNFQTARDGNSGNFSRMKELSQSTVIGGRDNLVFLNRSGSGKMDFSEFYASHTVYETPKLSRKLENLKVFVDWSSVEVFVNNGEYTITSVVFPELYSTEIVLRNFIGEMQINEVNFYELNSIH